MDKQSNISKKQALAAKEIILKFQNGCKHLKLVQIEHYTGNPFETATTRICTNCGITETCGEQYSSQFDKLSTWETIAELSSTEASHLEISPINIWLPLDDKYFTNIALSFETKLRNAYRRESGPGSGM